MIEEPPAIYEWVAELGPDVTPPQTDDHARPARRDGARPRRSSSSPAATTASPSVTFECALDGTAYSSCTSPEQFSDLTRGNHVLLVRARDGVGNFDPTPARYEWTVAAPPLTTILTAPGEMTESTSAKFTFAADVPGSTFWCWLDGVLDESCSSPKSYTDLAPGRAPVRRPRPRPERHLGGAVGRVRVADRRH